ACSQKLQAANLNTLKSIGSFLLDFTPAGDVKAFIEAEDRFDYLIATIGIIPGAGDTVSKLLKEAKVALKAGYAKKASQLTKEAESLISESKLAGKGNIASNISKPNEPIRFIDGVTVKDIKTGQSYSGTVDLKPTIDRIQSGGTYPH